MTNNDDISDRPAVPGDPPPNQTYEEARRSSLPSFITSIDVKELSLAILALLALVAVFKFAQSVLFPLVLAMLLNLVLSPVVGWLGRRGIPAFVSTLGILGGIVTAVALLISMFYAPAEKFYEESPQHIKVVEYKLAPLVRVFKNMGEATAKVDEIANMGKSDTVIETSEKKPSIANRVLNTTSEVGLQIGLTTVLLFFLLASGDRMLEKVVEFMPTWRDKRRVVAIARDIQKSVSKYLFTTFLVNVTLGIVIGSAMAVIGLPNPVMWGVMAALLNFIPFMGALVGATIVFFAALVCFESPVYALLAPGLYIGINIVEANFVTPTLLGRSISLNPVLLIIVFTLFAWLWGIPGAIIAVPVLAVVKIGCDHHETLQPLGNFLGE